MGEEYRLRREDFVPIKGLLRYIDRTSLNSLSFPRNMSETEIRSAEKRTLLLTWYNASITTGGILASVCGLASLLE